ncbi:MAG: hypothetical protein JWM11_4829 [Planctomycetaceae bacterium]|nr:hypothetical protein [Planctomycetaceae bacterium]
MRFGIGYCRETSGLDRRMVTTMNGLFRVAFRTLCWGLIVTSVVASTVTFNGIHPDVLFAFKSKTNREVDATTLANNILPRDDEKEPSLVFARATTSSRLDVPENFGLTPDPQLDPTLPKVSPVPPSSSLVTEDEATLEPQQPFRSRRRPSRQGTDEFLADAGSTDEIAGKASEVEGTGNHPRAMNLPPHPDVLSPRDQEQNPELAVEPSDSAVAETMNVNPQDKDSDSPRPSSTLRERTADRSAPKLRSDGPTAPESSALTPGGREVEQREERRIAPPPPPPPEPTIQKTPQPPLPPVDSTPVNPRLNAAAVSEFRMGPAEYSFLDRLTQMQRQLDQIALAQQQDRHAAQSAFETTQMFQQRKLEDKLEGIERGLRDLRAERTLALPAPTAVTPPSPAPVAVPTQTSVVPRSATASTVISAPPLVQEEQPGPDGKPRFSVNSQRGGDLRELLDALAQKANFNLVLAINVEGDVELSLQSVTADEALEAIKKTTGYVVEKSGRKVYVGQPGTHMNQRQEFLPPIIMQAQ